MNQFRAAVQTIVSERSFGSILSIRVDEPLHARHGQVVRARIASAAMVRRPAVGDVWRFEGPIAETQWGPQLEALSAVQEVPSGRLIVAFLAAHVPGVGNERAERLWNRWGFELETVLSDVGRVAEIATVLAPDRPTLAPALATACCAAWSTSVAEIRTVVWLAKRGIHDVRIARRVIAVLGEGAIESLQANPYILVALVAWKSLDALALQLLREAGIENARCDPRRLVGAVDEAVKRAIRNGDTAINPGDLLATVEKILGGSALAAKAIELGELEGAIVRAGSVWRAPGCASMEDDLVARLHAISAGHSSVALPAPEALRAHLRDLRISGHLMHEEQQEAVLRLLARPVACLQGAAGVGKTTAVQAICDVWTGAGGRVVLCTVAGKAALRLSRATQRLGTTMARLLGELRERDSITVSLADGIYSATEEARAKRRLQELADITSATLVVIDEASMVDLPSAYELVTRMPQGARLLLVGDEAQLPPVGFGLIYHRLVEDGQITARLVKVHRQSSESGIPAVSAAIRKRVLPFLPPYAGRGAGVSHLACGDDALQDNVEKVWEDLDGETGGVLICTATHGGAAGITELNKRLQRRRATLTNVQDALKGVLGHWYCVGDPVVWLRNDYSRGLFNGLLGGVVEIDSEERALEVRFEGYDDPHRIESDQLIDMSLAYAITCHKAQGSQAPVVIVPLYSTRVMDVSWIYTAITRAEKQVVLVGRSEVLAQALERHSAAARRNVGLRWA